MKLLRRRDRRRNVLRGIVAGSVAFFLAGCDAASRNSGFQKVLGAGEHLTRRVQRALTSRRSMAQEFTEADLSPDFRSNGTAYPDSAAYRALVAEDFASYKLRVDGLVATPKELTLAELRALPSRTQITRHDCVEGWSAIGKWKGVVLADVLAMVQPKSAARFVVFHCADPMDDEGTMYYESVDMEDALHPQTLLAYELNGEPLPVKNGAPVRMRIERQLGYKHAKYVMRVELVESFDKIAGGNGGYWEDQGYEWYAGI
jgi:DMSO/TMAO reductase YedYZ molybdopterin-dependent catalytic subunit